MIQIPVLYDYYKKSNGIVTDSRKVTEGTIFFALKGERFDGNDFVEDAIRAGARYVVADRPSCVGDRVLLVDDVLQTLQKLAAYHRDTFNIPVIGITGSCGKTTTKELIKAVLSKSFNVVATKDNFNNHIGVPLSLFEIDEKTDIAVIEMGASAPGEIEFLVNIVKPTCGIITNVEKVHLEGFGSFAGVKKTKGELYDYLRQKGAVAFVNHDNEVLQSMINARAGLCSCKYGAEYQKSEVVTPTAEDPYLKISIPISYISKNSRNHEYKFADTNDINDATERKLISTKLIGSYNVDNVLAALCIGTYFNVPLSKCVDAVEEYSPENNRSQLLNTGRNTVIVDTYNANPASMKASLASFMASHFQNVVLILGEMKEIGETSLEEHAKAIKLAQNVMDSSENGMMFLVGEGMIEAKKQLLIPGINVFCFENVDELISCIQEHPLEGRTVFIKGSHSNHLEKVVEFL